MKHGRTTSHANDGRRRDRKLRAWADRARQCVTQDRRRLRGVGGFMRSRRIPAEWRAPARCTRPASVRCRSRACPIAAICQASAPVRAVRLARPRKGAIMLHRTTRAPTPGIHADSRGSARIRLKEPVRRDVEDYAVITTCNGRAARAPPRCDPATRPRAGLCGPANTAPRFLGDFDGNHGQSPGSILRKSSICH